MRLALLNPTAARVPNYDSEWRQHLAELLDLPLPSIPLGSAEAEAVLNALQIPQPHTPAQGHEQVNPRREAPRTLMRLTHAMPDPRMGTCVSLPRFTGKHEGELRVGCHARCREGKPAIMVD